jgi:hypothetical protein
MVLRRKAKQHHFFPFSHGRRRSRLSGVVFALERSVVPRKARTCSRGLDYLAWREFAWTALCFCFCFSFAAWSR